MPEEDQDNQQAVLVCDIGNSRIKLGCFQGAELKKNFAALRALDGQESDRLRAWLNPLKGTMKSIIIGSVVPAAEQPFAAFLATAVQAKPLLLRADAPMSFPSRYAAGQAGIDRLANAAAALAIHPPPMIIVDAGTAVNIEVIDSTGTFLGGAILPGLDLQIQALASRSSALSNQTITQPETPIGSDTQSSLNSGIYYGIAGGIDRIIADTKLTIGDASRILLTGGAAPLIMPYLKHECQLEEFLTLHGMKKLGEHQAV